MARVLLRAGAEKGRRYRYAHTQGGQASLRPATKKHGVVRRATTVLVVEDDFAIRNMILEALKIEGYNPNGVADTPGALAHIRGERPDLIITDYHLPGADGLELLRSLQAEGFGDIPALVISADSRPPDWPVTSFIPKPFDLDAILRAVRRALGKRPAGPDQRADTRGQPGWASWLAAPEMAPA